MKIIIDNCSKDNGSRKASRKLSIWIVFLTERIATDSLRHGVALKEICGNGRIVLKETAPCGYSSPYSEHGRVAGSCEHHRNSAAGFLSVVSFLTGSVEDTALETISQPIHTSQLAPYCSDYFSLMTVELVV